MTVPTLVLELLDADENVVFDFLDSTGVNNPRGVPCTLTTEGLVLGQGEQDVEFFAGDSPGAHLARSRIGLAETTFSILLGPVESNPDLVATAGDIDRLLRRGGTIRWQPGDSDVRYIDFLTGDVPGLFRGQHHGLLKVLAQLQDPDGMPVRIYHQPSPRGEPNPLSNTLRNPLLILDMGLNGIPDDWSLSDTGLTKAWDEETSSWGFTAPDTSTYSLYQTIDDADPGDVWTASCEARVAAPGRAAVQVDFLDSSDVVVATKQSALQALPSFQRISVTSDPAPAGTAKVRILLVADNASAGSVAYLFRQAQLEQATEASTFAVGPQFVSNDPAVSGGCVLPVLVDGDVDAPASLTVAAEAGAIEEVMAARRTSDGSLRRLYDYVNATKWAQLDSSANGWTRTLGTDTTSAADADGSGGNVASITHSTSPTVGAMRSRVTRADRIDSLRGEFDVWVRVEANAAKDFWLQLRWGLGPTVSYTEDEVPYRVAGAASFDYEMVKIGKIRVPERPSQVGSLTIELWTRQDTAGAVTLRADYLLLLPADEEVGAVVVPDGLTEAAAGEELRSDAARQSEAAEKTDSSGNHLFLLDVEGPTPATVPPKRLVVLALKFGDASIAEHPRPKDVLTREPVVTLGFAPRWRQ